jgi:2-succinyl-5-enolpyruvyl-6-hydroxy-3-cyclohexene-1-carboxylate synthase
VTAPNPSTAMARVLVDTLAVHGVDLIAMSPGSRSAAIAIAAAADDRMETVVFVDERSAAFFALGRAKASGSPAAVLCTSGTAVANWFPAVVEADSSATPLILISADRPFELRGVGANQTIDQTEIFGAKVRAFLDLEAPGLEDRALDWRSAVVRAVSAARGPLPGPVHLNVGFREPTVPSGDDGRSRSAPYPHELGLPGVAYEAVRPPRNPPGGIELPEHSRGLVVAGDGEYDRKALLEVAEGLGWPVLATAMSGMRGMGVIDSYHHLLADGVPGRLRPVVAVAIGAIGPSQRLETLVSTADVRIRVDYWGRSIDPSRDATHRLVADPVEFLAGIGPEADPGWGRAWQQSAGSVRTALDRRLATEAVTTCAGVARAVDGVAREALVVASSLPIRAVDAHLTGAGKVVANRGASGIDGFVATALGVASVSGRTLAVSGDLSLFHDANGFLNDGQQDCTMVVINNRGGGLFDHLPQRAHAPYYERLFVAAQDRDIADLARFHRIGFELVSQVGDLAGVIEDAISSGGRRLIEVPVDREIDLEMWRELDRVALSRIADDFKS